MCGNPRRKVNMCAMVWVEGWFASIVPLLLCSHTCLRGDIATKPYARARKGDKKGKVQPFSGRLRYCCEVMKNLDTSRS